ALTCSRPSSTSEELQTFLVNTPATAVPSASSAKVRSQRPQSLYPARATRSVTPAIGGIWGNGVASGETASDMGLRLIRRARSSQAQAGLGAFSGVGLALNET